MGISKAQKAGVMVVCKCGCGEEFNAFPVYRSRAEGGGLFTKEYKRGHHPNCKKTQTQNKPTWNKGMTKNDHPSIARMGFQPGHAPYNDWSHVNTLLQTNPAVRQKWLAAKKGQIAWNLGLSGKDYHNPIKTGKDHGNWKGGHGGFRDTAEWKILRLAIHRRDNWTCQECGDRAHKGRGSRINLEVHHIVSVNDAPELIKDPNNLVTLCRNCHFKTHNFGAKARKQSGK